MDRTVSAFRRFIAGTALLVAVVAVLLPVSSGCGKEEVLIDDAATHDPDLLPARADFRATCSVCHGKNGEGATYLFPPLQGSEWMNYSPEPLILVVLHGLEGPLTVRGEEYMNKMAPLGHQLTNERIAAILTYVRASWGNRGSKVTPEQVARVRKEHVDRNRPWTVEELEPLLVPEPAGVDSVATGS